MRTPTMLTPPTISAETIAAVLGQQYALPVRQVTFLPIGADVNTAVYRVEDERGAASFLKLRRADFAEIAVAVPAYLHSQGTSAVMAPVPTLTHRLWATAHGFDWILYPFFAGHNGFETPLTDAHWAALGRALRAVHVTSLPPALARLVPREEYAPRWREVVARYAREAETRAYADPLAREFAAFWLTKRDEIRTMLARTEQLAAALQQRSDAAFVLCHTDLHAGNILLAVNGDLAIVDWDNPIFAPRERDLMFVGGGIGAIWDPPHEEAMFYAGYGPIDVDPIALAYYRYERIIEDLAAFGEQIFGAHGSVADREHGLRETMAQFHPDRVVGIAHKTYQQLPDT